MNIISHANIVIDIGTGKGQDLGRYFKLGVKKLIAVDSDPSALTELIKRKYELTKSKKYNQKVSIYVQTVVADMNDPFESNIQKLENIGIFPETAQAVVCNLAIHYFLKDIASMRNFIMFVQSIVEVNGSVILTYMDGIAIHNMFIEKGIKSGQYWTLREGETVKYSLQRLYSDDLIRSSGQKIGVLLPFSNGSHYEEFLVNSDSLEKEFTQKGFSVISKTSVKDHVKEFKARNKVMADGLTDQDIEYASLYKEMRLKRVS
jgi:hypothetical protein